MISTTARYAFHVLGALAGRSDRMVRGEELAEATGLPANYLSKILNQLRKHGFVESRKGWGGGFRIRPEARDRPIRGVLELFDGPAPDDCAFGFPSCDGESPCPLHDRWLDVRRARDRMIEETTVADLAGDSR